MNTQVYTYHGLIGNSWDLEVSEIGSGDRHGYEGVFRLGLWGEERSETQWGHAFYSHASEAARIGT